MKENAFQRMVDPLKRKIALSIARAIVKLVDDGQNIQRMQVALFKNELRDSVERFQDYGFSSHPHPEAEAIVLFLGGDRSHGAVIKVDDRRFRFKPLAQGEVAMYTDEEDYIVFRRNKQMEISTNSLTINAANEIELNTQAMRINATTFDVVCPSTNYTGNVAIEGALAMIGTSGGNGNIVANGTITDHLGSMDEMRGVYNSHTHDENNSITGAPNQTMS